MKPLSLCDAFRSLLDQTPEAVALTFVGDDGSDAQYLTFAELAATANDIAAYLHGHCRLAAGDRAVLVYPPSLAFAKAFLGCLIAGIVPVPVVPPDPAGRDAVGFRALLADCSASAVLSDGRYLRAKRIGALRRVFGQSASAWPDTEWHCTDNVPVASEPLHRAWRPPDDDLLFLQYTSGSTGTPKGVQITYANVAHQLACNRATLGLGPNVRAVFWVPHYHDLGLISGILSSLCGNGQLYMISPMAFLRSPALWPAVMSRVRATHTAAPNFAYELVMRRTTPGQRAQWDLSALRVALNAGEPVRASTIRMFTDAFAVARFNPAALMPVYGLAEHTVGVTAGGGRVLHVDRGSLRDGVVQCLPGDDADAVCVVGCGRPLEGVRLRIVDPVTCAATGDGRVGEIWIDSPSKARGYHGRPEETRAVFLARRLDVDDGVAYLRTGDLGFLQDGELVITGR